MVQNEIMHPHNDAKKQRKINIALFLSLILLFISFSITTYYMVKVREIDGKALDLHQKQYKNSLLLRSNSITFDEFFEKAIDYQHKQDELNLRRKDLNGAAFPWVMITGSMLGLIIYILHFKEK